MIISPVKTSCKPQLKGRLNLAANDQLGLLIISEYLWSWTPATLGSHLHYLHFSPAESEGYAHETTHSNISQTNIT